VRVVGYACARNLAPATSQDTELYLLLGDLHLPPAYWFYGEAPSSGAPEVAWPDWVDAAPAVIRNRTRLLRYYRLGTQDLARGRWQQIKSPVPPHVDIFGIAGRDLVRFLDALASLPATVRRRLHFIQTGDMFELWMGREYQLVPGADGVPSWRTADSPDRVADWCLEVMVQNAPVISAFNQLEGSGLAEVCYLSGNHDGYLRKPEVPVQLGLPVRQPSYRGLHDDLLAEHGHRFDDSNLDNVDASRRLSGPALTNRVFKDPNKRSLESFCRELLGYANPKMRDIHLLGATLTFLQERFEQKKKPFAIYAMAHTHAPMLIRFDIRAGYIMKDHEEATNGVTLP
jgi:hypothetical protein